MKSPAKNQRHLSKSQLLRKLQEAGSSSADLITLKLQPDKEQLSEDELAQIPSLLNAFKALSRMLRALAATDSPEGNAAALKLLQETSANVRLLHKLPADRLLPTTRNMRYFPVMAAPKANAWKKVNLHLNRLKVGSSFPKYYLAARSPQDAFADIADLIIAELQTEDENLACRDEEDRSKILLRAQRILPKYLDQHPNFPELLEKLSKLVHSDRDKRTRGALMTRIRERILNRLRAKLEGAVAPQTIQSNCRK